MKIDVIEYCGDCSKRYYKGNDLWCEPEEKETYENNLCPDWCPLPNAPNPALLSDSEGRCHCDGWPLESDYCKYCGGKKD